MSPRSWTGDWRTLAEESMRYLQRARGTTRSVAVLEDEGGVLHRGVSISIRALPASSLCAEPAAVASMLLTGATRISKVLLVTAGGADPAPPCGRCLQFMREFGPRAEVRWGSIEKEFGRSTISRLLPQAFADYRKTPRD